MATILLTVSIFALVMLAMAVGVILRRPCLRGSCGGPEVLDATGEPLTCATCPNRKKRRDDQKGSLPVADPQG